MNKNTIEIYFKYIYFCEKKILSIFKIQKIIDYKNRGIYKSLLFRSHSSNQIII